MRPKVGQLVLLKPETKLCARCKLTLPVSAFGKDSTNPFNFRSNCRKCEYAVRATPEWKAKRNAHIAKLKLAGRFPQQTVEYQLLSHAKQRAKKESVTFALTLSDIVIPKYCPALGLELKRHVGRGPCDASPTLDRHIGALGYVKGNVSVISYKANRAKSNLTPAELRMLADYLAKQ